MILFFIFQVYGPTDLNVFFNIVTPGKRILLQYT